jgi:hypothetical protein
MDFAAGSASAPALRLARYRVESNYAILFGAQFDCCLNEKGWWLARTAVPAAMVSHPDSDGLIPAAPLLPSVSPPRAMWPETAAVLRTHHLGDLAALCLYAFSPLALVASQFFYAAGPFFGERALQMARLLESEEAMVKLAAPLTSDEEDPHPDPGAAID